MKQNDNNDAKTRYKLAFERLKCNEPTLLKKGSIVSQNNVAREAGFDPSALKKSRFPDLISEIQAWVKYKSLGPLDTNPSKKRIILRPSKSDRLQAMKKQRDSALQLLVEADALIVELNKKLLEMEKTCAPNNISPLSSTTKNNV